MKFDNALNASRVMFIFSCVMAHSALTHGEIVTKFGNLILAIWSFCACIGVPCFLITSGILFRKKNIIHFVKAKFTSIVVPWIFCGTLVYMISDFSSYSIIEYIRFVLGVGSYLYYIPVLLITYIIFYILPEKTICCILCIIINVISLIVSQFDLLNIGNDFLDIFNWIGYFAIGCLINKFGLLNKIKSYKKLIIYVCIPACILCCVLAYIFEVETYFNLFVFISIPFYFSLVYGISALWFENSTIIQNIGKISYTIYLIHMPVASVFKRLVRMSFIEAYVLIPFFVVFVVVMVINLYKAIIKKNDKLMNISKFLLGLR